MPYPLLAVRLFSALEEGLLVRVVESLPAVAAVIFLVIRFLQHIKAVEDRREKMDEARHESLRNLGATCHAFQAALQEKNDELQDRANAVIDRNTEALGRVGGSLERFDNWLERQERQERQERPERQDGGHPRLPATKK